MILRCRIPRIIERSRNFQCLITNSPRAWTSQQSLSRFRTFTAETGHEGAPIKDGNDVEAEEDNNAFLEEYKKSYSAPAPKSNASYTFDTKWIGKEITLHGHIGVRNDAGKKLMFNQLTGPGREWKIQIVSKVLDPAAPNVAHKVLKKMRPNSAISVTGQLGWNKAVELEIIQKAYSHGQALSKHLELTVSDVTCLNKFPDDIIVSDGVQFPPEQRHLQIMHDKDLYDRLMLRSEVNRAFRHQLNKWTEVETPILFKSTPEGAREFLVPLRKVGLAYALPQSPQQYKQILMASGIGRYFQFARCFRDEDLRADRQPEFTQLDLEMAFADGETVMNAVENMIRSVTLPTTPIPYFPDAKNKFPRLTYQHAMDRYGSDKPDTRNKHLIHRIEAIIPENLTQMLTKLHNPIVEIVRLPISDDPTRTRGFVRKFMSSAEGKEFEKNPDGGPGIFIYDSSMPLQALNAFGFESAEALTELFDDQGEELQDGDLLVVQARPDAPQSGGSTALGRLRTALRHAASDKNLMGPLPKVHEFLWVVDFPMFTPNDGIDPGQGGSAGFKATHHPFTAPRTARDVDLLATDPLAARADHYDLVVNGVELGGGSRRIHNAKVQEYIMRNILKMSEERLQDFSHLFEALRSGCPPHAGFALGFDRLIAVLSWTDSVRDVIAFPKNNRGEDPLIGSPGKTTDAQQATYHLKAGW